MLARRVLVSSVAATVLIAVGTGRADHAAAAAGDAEDNSRLAEAQFLIHLLSSTDLRPSDVTCSLPPPHDPGGEMICFALIGGRDTVAAVAAPVGPGVYTFTAVSKWDGAAIVGSGMPPATPADAPSGPASAPASADAAVLQLLGEATTDVDGLAVALTEGHQSVVSVDALRYDASTVTLHVAVTTTAGTPAERDALAFYITDRMALLWEQGQPLRDPAATIRPRLEVVVDGVIYGTPFDVMVDVAEYTVDEGEWLAISTGAATGAKVRGPGSPRRLQQPK